MLHGVRMPNDTYIIIAEYKTQSPLCFYRWNIEAAEDMARFCYKDGDGAWRVTITDLHTGTEVFKLVDKTVLERMQK